MSHATNAGQLNLGILRRAWREPIALELSDAAWMRVRAARMTVEEVIVTARRREESLQNVPISITPFSGTAIEQRDLQTLEDKIDTALPCMENF